MRWTGARARRGNRILWLLMAVSMVGVAARPAAARDIYVAATGSNSNTGGPTGPRSASGQTDVAVDSALSWSPSAAQSLISTSTP